MKEYKIDIDESFLKVLGPQMYTNIYYVLGEVIANAYDADAENVYLTINSEKKIITIEDDGIGMNYSDINNKFLRVAVESRTSSSDSKTLKGRFKLGRKGIGKLAVLSISNNVEISSIKNTELNGFILSTKLENNKVLKSIPEKEITFNKINLHGTKILMKDILIEIPKQLKTAYGDTESQTIKYNCNASIYIRTNDSSTADELSKEYGEKPIVAFNINDKFNRVDKKDQKNKKEEETTNVTTVPLIRGNEILNLDDNFMIVKKSGKNPTLIHSIYSYNVKKFKEYMSYKRSFVPSNAINYKKNHYFNFIDNDYEE